MIPKIVIRTFIVLFGLIAVSVVGALIFAGDGNPTEELHAAGLEEEQSRHDAQQEVREL